MSIEIAEGDRSPANLRDICADIRSSLDVIGQRLGDLSESPDLAADKARSAAVRALGHINLAASFVNAMEGHMLIAKKKVP
jgi:hypothetical protein